MDNFYHSPRERGKPKICLTKRPAKKIIAKIAQNAANCPIKYSKVIIYFIISFARFRLSGFSSVRLMRTRANQSAETFVSTLSSLASKGIASPVSVKAGERNHIFLKKIVSKDSIISPKSKRAIKISPAVILA